MKASSFLLFSFFLVVLSLDSFAQATSGVSAAGRRMDDFDNQRTKAQRDAMTGEMRGKKPTKEELQNAYNEIVVKLNGGGTVPAAFIAEATSKVHKHAARLKANFAFPKPAKEGETKLPDVAAIHESSFVSFALASTNS